MSKTSSHIERTGDVIYCGHLKRKGLFFGIYQACFCELTPNGLFVKKSKSSQKCDAFIEITTDTRIDIFENEKIPRFIVSNGGKDDICLSGENPEEVMTWVVALRSCTFKNYPKLTMDDFDIISVIGRGYYGKVMLCKRKDTGELYAIKTIHKNRLVSNNKVYTVLSERNILVKSHHPFIVELKYAFQTDTKFYLVLEYVPGGELFTHVREAKKLTFDEARLYIAEIALAIDYLHSIGIVYRDLKTENILLASDGHIKLTDFGLSKDISFLETTTTFCGTIEYIAPEIIRREQYTYMVDWWSLGVLSYELIYGATPFFNRNRARLFQAITMQEVRFPTNATPDQIDFISKLLTKDPKKRSTFQDLKDHDFWGGLNFDDILSKKISPKFKPNVSNPENVSNFDSEFTQEPAADSVASPVVGNANFPGFSYTAIPVEDGQKTVDLPEAIPNIQ
ncbi:AGC family protein kinase [Tritrichomonas foetus]|uniref:non-specific serine/threonine protein kinase n=1 Tax=Tritrichomonas foetus TaxID=1144522 RepID=A0A1J4K9X6_9EUKA|nr:AGC family protein kinase [Tritrichomonas foetus]|eukprot:OHT08265.1 AGC family protein kinase [Tritrichomonas foetus]